MKDKMQPTSLQKFRNKYSRIDYYPHRDSVVVIERLRAKCPTYTTRQILDVLIEAGEKSLFPESKMGQGRDALKVCESWHHCCAVSAQYLSQKVKLFHSCGAKIRPEKAGSFCAITAQLEPCMGEYGRRA